ncbi:MAG: hypothetical protein M0Z53_08715, partial [Thermaerobacter sp.]|nr:hypothetical protein [Thermaerobacter sp.]
KAPIPMGIAQAFWTLGPPSYPTSNFLYMVNRSRMLAHPLSQVAKTGQQGHVVISQVQHLSGRLCRLAQVW